MNQKITPHFLSTGITAVSNKQSNSIPNNELPHNTNSLLPPKDILLSELKYDQTPPTVQYRALRQLAPNLSQTPNLLFPNNYYEVGVSIQNLLLSPSNEWLSKLENIPDAKNHLNALQQILEENIDNHELLKNGINALKTA